MCKLHRLRFLVGLTLWSVISHASTTDLRPEVKETTFGQCDEGLVRLFELSNIHHLRVCVMEFGTTIVGIETPDRQGRLADVALGFNDPMAYAKAKLTFGTAGRVVGRIALARFDLDGKTFPLTPNSGPNLLHGGTHGFARRLWKGEIVSSDPPIIFRLNRF